MRVIVRMPPPYSKLTVALFEFEVDWDFTPLPSTEAVKFLPRAAGMVITALPVVALESATVKVIVCVLELNVRAETEDSERTEME